MRETVTGYKPTRVHYNIGLHESSLESIMTIRWKNPSFDRYLLTFQVRIIIKRRRLKQKIKVKTR